MHHSVAHGSVEEHGAAANQRPEQQAANTARPVREGSSGAVTPPRRLTLLAADSDEDTMDGGASWRVLLSFAGISVSFPPPFCPREQWNTSRIDNLIISPQVTTPIILFFAPVFMVGLQVFHSSPFARAGRAIRRLCLAVPV